MSLRDQHSGHRIEPDEGSGGFYIAYCLTCHQVVGDYDNEGDLVFDDELQEPATKPKEYVIDEDGNFMGVREIP